MRTLVAGIGSDILGDDGVGVHAARKLRDRLVRPDLDVIELGTAGLGLIDFVEGYDRLIAIDAITTGKEPGTVHVLRGEEVTRAAHLGAAHGADLPTVLAVGRQLAGGPMPKEVIVIAIEALDLTTFSEVLTKDVSEALPRVAAIVEEILDRTE